MKKRYYCWCSITGENTRHSRAMTLTCWFWEKNMMPVKFSKWIDSVFIELRAKGINPVLQNCGVICGN